MNAQETYDAIRSTYSCGKNGCPCKTGPNIHCPNSSGHSKGDQHPSCGLSLDKANDTIAVVCQQCDGAMGKGFIARLLKEQGLWPSREPDSLDDHRASKGERVARYDFRDIEGRLLAIKERWEWGRPDPDTGKRPKRFVWRLPDDRDTRKVAQVIPNAQMPLYGTESLKGIKPGSRVWIVEGEKARDACVEAGIPYVLGTAFGSGQRDFGDTLHILQGHHVRVWPDNDDEGRKFAARLRVELRGIARSFEIITPDVPEKGDAYEYFQAGGTVEGLESNVDPDELTVQRESQDSLVVLVPTVLGTVRFSFSEMVRSAKALDTLLEIVFTKPGYPKIRNRINLESLSARKDLLVQLNHITGLKMKENGINLWEAIVLQVFTAAREAYDQYDSSVLLRDIEQVTPPSWMIDGLLVDQSITICFGDGSATKSWLAMRVAQCLYYGLPFLPELTDWDSQGKVRIKKQDAIPTRRKGVRSLWLDWENTASVFKWRMDRVAQGLGVDPWQLAESPFRYKAANGVPLADMAYALRKLIEKEGIDLLIIDSAAMAAGAEAEKSDTANRFFQQGLKVLGEGLTVLIIAHVSKSSDIHKPFGSVFWHNNARYTYYVERLEGSKALTMDGQTDVLIHPRKVNEFALPKQFGYSIDFNDGLGDQESGSPVIFRPLGAAKSLIIPDAAQSLPERFLAIITDHPGITPDQLAVKAGLVGDDNKRLSAIEPRRTINRLIEKGKVGKIDGGLWPVTHGSPGSNHGSNGSEAVPF